MKKNSNSTSKWVFRARTWAWKYYFGRYFQSIMFVESINLFNYVSFYIIQMGKSCSDRSPLLLYQTCIDPWNRNYVRPLYMIMPINQLILHINTGCIVGFNLYLYKFLNEETNKKLGIILLSTPCNPPDFILIDIVYYTSSFQKSWFFFRNKRNKFEKRKKEEFGSSKSWSLLSHYPNNLWNLLLYSLQYSYRSWCSTVFN